jgi:2,3-bisphosphoglycerate-dependent phosphoglycerate mutase
MKKAILFFVLILMVQASAFAAAQQITTVILTRHAEKAASPEDDPALTAQGKERADLLASMLEKSGVNGIYTSQYLRTRLTAEPLSKKLGVPVETVDASTTNKLVASILTKHAGGTVVVVCHSNTLPEIVQALGGGTIPEIGDMEYDNLYIVTVYQKGVAKVVRMKYLLSSEQVCQ